MTVCRSVYDFTVILSRSILHFCSPQLTPSLLVGPALLTGGSYVTISQSVCQRRKFSYFPSLDFSDLLHNKLAQNKYKLFNVTKEKNGLTQICTP